MAGEPNPFHDPEVSGYLDEKNKRIAELEAALWPLAEIGRYNPSVPDDESILSDNAVFHGGDRGRTTLTMANARHALDVLCPDAGKE